MFLDDNYTITNGSPASTTINTPVAEELGRYVHQLLHLGTHVLLTHLTCIHLWLSTHALYIKGPCTRAHFTKKSTPKCCMHSNKHHRKLRPSNSPGNSYYRPTCPPIPASTDALSTNPTLLVLSKSIKLQDRCRGCHCSLEWLVCFARHAPVTSRSFYLA